MFIVDLVNGKEMAEITSISNGFSGLDQSLYVEISGHWGIYRYGTFVRNQFLGSHIVV